MSPELPRRNADGANALVAPDLDSDPAAADLPFVRDDSPTEEAPKQDRQRPHASASGQRNPLRSGSLLRDL
jgi:hypothetical protein